MIYCSEKHEARDCFRDLGSMLKFSRLTEPLGLKETCRKKEEERSLVDIISNL